MKLDVQPEHLYAGVADRPFFVSVAAVLAGGTELGFRNVVVGEADKLPLPFAVPVDKGDFNTTAMGIWTRAATSLELPSAVKWAADVTQKGGGPVLVPVNQGTGFAADITLGRWASIFTLGLVAGAGSAWLLAKRTKRRAR